MVAKGPSALDVLAAEIGREVPIRRVPIPGIAPPAEAYGIVAQSIIQTGHGESRDTSVATCALGFSINLEGDGVREFVGLAKVHFGVGSGKHSVDVDWRTGTQLSFPCSFAEVVGAYATDAATEFDQVTLRACMAWGTRPDRCYPTRTFANLAIAGLAASPVFPIPPFAYALQVGATAYPGTLTVDFLSGSAGGVVQSVSGPTLLAALVNEGVKFPGHARFFRVNNGAAEGIVVSPFFALAL